MSAAKHTPGQWPDAICSGNIRYGKSDNYDGFYLADASHGIPTIGAVSPTDPVTLRGQHVRVFNYPGQTEAIASQLVERWNAYDALRAENDRLRSENDRFSKIILGCDWWWPAEDTSSDTCQADPYEIISEADAGAVVAIARGGIVETTFHAWLPPEEDSDSDDDFLVKASSEAEARRLVEAEKTRRAALSEGAQ